MKVALFDLDHTLIPFDAGMAWTHYLVGLGALPADAEARHLAFCQQYVAGTLDIRAMHRANVLPLSRVPHAQLAEWLSGFEAAIAPELPPAMHALVRQHRDAGHRCAIVTATTRFLAEPFARLFGDIELIATEPAMSMIAGEARYDGEMVGAPCYREEKVARVAQWLAPQGGLAAAEDSWFYSDSMNDVPLLSAVAHPVAVRPEARLRAHAQALGWPIVDAG